MRRTLLIIVVVILLGRKIRQAADRVALVDRRVRVEDAFGFVVKNVRLTVL